MLPETIVFIDGGYLSKISKHLGDGTYIDFDLNTLAHVLAKSESLWCKKVFYYTAPPFQADPPTKEQITRKSKYDKFIGYLKRIPNFIVREGRCQYVDGDYHQKGVDTLLTMDLFDVCLHEKVDVIILLACDTDFVPILNKLREDKLKVIIFYYNDYVRGSSFSMSNHILTACDKSICMSRKFFDDSKRIKK